MATIVYICSLDIQIFLGDKIKKNIDLTRGWIEVGSWLEVDLGSRLARVTLQLSKTKTKPITYQLDYSANLKP